MPDGLANQSHGRRSVGKGGIAGGKESFNHYRALGGEGRPVAKISLLLKKGNADII